MDKEIEMRLLSMILVVMGLACCPWVIADTRGDTPQQLASEIQEQVNINTADADTIRRVLKGIGMSKAQAIVAYREEHGRFYTLDELLAVRGVGKATLRKNEGRILLVD